MIWWHPITAIWPWYDGRKESSGIVRDIYGWWNFKSAMWRHCGPVVTVVARCCARAFKNGFVVWIADTQATSSLLYLYHVASWAWFFAFQMVVIHVLSTSMGFSCPTKSICGIRNGALGSKTSNARWSGSWPSRCLTHFEIKHWWSGPSIKKGLICYYASWNGSEKHPALSFATSKEAGGLMCSAIFARWLNVAAKKAGIASSLSQSRQLTGNSDPLVP